MTSRLIRAEDLWKSTASARERRWVFAVEQPKLDSKSFSRSSARLCAALLFRNEVVLTHGECRIRGVSCHGARSASMSFARTANRQLLTRSGLRMLTGDTLCRRAPHHNRSRSSCQIFTWNFRGGSRETMEYNFPDLLSLPCGHIAEYINVGLVLVYKSESRMTVRQKSDVEGSVEGKSRTSDWPKSRMFHQCSGRAKSLI
jgi:hypothetical protein